MNSFKNYPHQNLLFRYLENDGGGGGEVDEEAKSFSLKGDVHCLYEEQNT